MDDQAVAACKAARDQALDKMPSDLAAEVREWQLLRCYIDDSDTALWWSPARRCVCALYTTATPSPMIAWDVLGLAEPVSESVADRCVQGFLLGFANEVCGAMSWYDPVADAHYCLNSMATFCAWLRAQGVAPVAVDDAENALASAPPRIAPTKPARWPEHAD